MNKVIVDINNKNIQELIIEGAGCASCVGKIEIALNSIKGCLLYTSDAADE